MSNIIGVCVTRVHGEMCRTFIGSLLKSAKKAGLRVCVFQSVYDFDEEDESGAGYVFETIPYDNLCGIIILHDTIYDLEIKNKIIERGKARGIPVVMARSSAPGCFSLVGDFEDEYHKLLKDVIEKNDIKDVFYIGGRRNSGSDSQKRLAIFKKVCEEKGILFDDSKLDFGEYYEVPTYRIMERLLEGGKKPPRAIFCANDIMALAVIEKLEEAGYRVPEDVIVTGFDGLESAKYSKPRLTTCAESMDNLAQLSVDVIKKGIAGEIKPGEYRYKYEGIYAESAGFNSSGIGEEASSIDIFRRFRADEGDEEACNAWIDQMMVQPDFDGLRYVLPKLVGRERRLYSRTEAYWKIADSDLSRILPGDLMSVMIDDGGKPVCKDISLKDAIKESMEEATDSVAAFISVISLHKTVYGIAVDYSSDPLNEGGRINRYTVTLDRGLAIADSGERLLYLAEQINKNRYIDSLTGLNNIDGAGRWYKQYISDDPEDKTYMLIGVYSIITYQDIVNNYGLDFLENCLKYVSGTLKEMNPDCKMIARISSDSFVVAYTFEQEHNSSGEIETTISNFFTTIEAKRKENNRWNLMEVGCGYISDEHMECDSLYGYLNAAVATLYRNRAAINKKKVDAPTLKDGTKLMDFRRKVIELIQKDLFVYHFQPIVSAITGDIVAYEALMRTDASVGMTPLEVLDSAEMFDKYADLERTTFGHIFNRARSQLKDFEGKKIFINTIPGHFLTDVEVRNFREQYGELLDMFTIEITEAQTISPEEIEAISHLTGTGKMNDIAVDDYGMGHSNIVNLLEYKPQVVKVDRYLISNIQNDKNKQLFVRNLIEFASGANIKVLAEGVETAEELKTVIEFGVDLIQGYYLAKPAFEVLQELPHKLKDEIIKYGKNRVYKQ
jgi:EAL domain-containing protein (putative c-di-GMP-specific phosphodiesterase class I)/DNA-binding LacI/PurR family transcriptional regulator/GGDEF domain-containing protein